MTTTYLHMCSFTGLCYDVQMQLIRPIHAKDNPATQLERHMADVIAFFSWEDLQVVYKAWGDITKEDKGVNPALTPHLFRRIDGKAALDVLLYVQAVRRFRYAIHHFLLVRIFVIVIHHHHTFLSELIHNLRRFACAGHA